MLECTREAQSLAWHKASTVAHTCNASTGDKVDKEDQKLEAILIKFETMSQGKHQEGPDTQNDFLTNQNKILKNITNRINTKNKFIQNRITRVGQTAQWEDAHSSSLATRGETNSTKLSLSSTCTRHAVTHTE